MALRIPKLGNTAGKRWMTQKILYLVSEDWYFVSHRLPMARAARSVGYEVHVATRVDKHGAEIERENFHLHPIQWRRGSVNPLRFIRAVLEMRALYRRINPDLVHHVALVPTAIGSAAALGMPLQRLNALAGLGYVFTSATLKARLGRAIVGPLLAWLLTRPKTAALVQNGDDRAMIVRLGVRPENIALIPGSGVDVDALTPLPEPAGAFTVGFVGRLLDDKGVGTLVRAHEVLAKRGVAVRVLLAGAPDPANPASIPEPALADWRKRPNLVFLGHVGDVREVWAPSHIAVLPSRREGLPLSLLEAAACGRPLIATDVPGCREIARQGVNALLVPADDAAALAQAIETMMKDRDMRRRFGEASRQLAVNEFSSARIAKEIVALYANLLSASARSAA
jgi:glycosyltransferase involved in cell wall biosynthesis